MLDNGETVLSPSPDDSCDPIGRIGHVVGGKYKIRSYVKGGGFGEVYEGYNVNLPEQRLVIKFLKEGRLRDKFEKEAQLLCRLDHPNICRIIDYLPEEMALVVPFIDGKDCDQILKESGPLPEALFLNVSRAVMEAVIFAHERRIAHRDIKPANILIDKRSQVYLIDFGIAKEIGDGTTKTGYIALTPQFAAPERQVGEKNYNPFLSDIYEVAVTLFNLATNEMPYRNASNPNLRDWDQKPNSDLSPALCQLLKKALHPNPIERYQSVSEMAEDLKRVGSVFRRRSRGISRNVAVSAAVFVIAVAAILAVPGLWRKLLTGSAEVVSIRTPGEISLPTPSESVRTQDGHVADQTQGSTQSATAAKNEAPPGESTARDARPRMRVVVVPGENAVLTVDGTARSIASDFEVSPGRHSVGVLHPDYPLLEKVITVSQMDTSIVCELATEFAAFETLDLRLSVKPSLDGQYLEFNLNGARRRFTAFPASGLVPLAGKWQIEMKIGDSRGSGQESAAVDSCVSFPYGGGPRVAVRGSRGTVDFSTAAWKGKKVVPIQVYWSR